MLIRSGILTVLIALLICWNRGRPPHRNRTPVRTRYLPIVDAAPCVSVRVATVPFRRRWVHERTVMIVKNLDQTTVLSYLLRKDLPHE